MTDVVPHAAITFTDGSRMDTSETREQIMEQLANTASAEVICANTARMDMGKTYTVFLHAVRHIRDY